MRLAAYLSVAAVALPAALAPPLARAQSLQSEPHSIPSTTLTDREFLIGHKDGKPVVLSGELRIPQPGRDRLSVVVMLHGSGGVGAGQRDWAEWFNAMGVATFVIDSFTARGITSTVNDQAQLGRLAMIVDAYRALPLLAKHSRVDPERIVLMGFSRGGQAALYASLTRFQRMHASAGAAYAAYVAFYPDCRTRYRDDTDVAARPIRIYHGTADDYSPVDACRDYVARVRKAGKDIQLAEYAGAHHVFDGRRITTPVTLPKAQTTRRCRLEEVDDGRIVNSDSRQTFTYSDPCVEYGPTLAYDAQAHSEVQKALAALVAALLKPK